MAIGSDIGGAVGGLVGGAAVLAGAAGKGGERERKKALQAWEALKAVDFDMTRIPEADIRMFAEIRPDLVEMVLPLQPKYVQDSITGRSAMVGSLGRLEALRDEGLPQAERAARLGAQRQMGAQAKRDQDAVLRDLAERGRLSAGDEAATRMLATQASSDMAGDFAQQLSTAEEQNQIQGAQAAASLGESLRAGDTNLSAQNAGISNNYNELIAGIMNEGALANQQAKQQAQGYNVGTKNQLGVMKATNAQETASQNKNTNNQLKQQGYDNNLAKLRGYTTVLGALADSKDEERKNKQKAIMSVGQGAGKAGGSVFDMYSGGMV